MIRIQSGDTEFVLQLCKLDITLVYYINKNRASCPQQYKCVPQSEETIPENLRPLESCH